MISEISCMIIDVISNTLASCDYKDCNEICTDYLMDVANNCPVVFNNETFISYFLKSIVIYTPC